MSRSRLQDIDGVELCIRGHRIESDNVVYQNRPLADGTSRKYPRCKQCSKASALRAYHRRNDKSIPLLPKPWADACPNGHPKTPENLIQVTQRKRDGKVYIFNTCRICRDDRGAEYRKKYRHQLKELTATQDIPQPGEPPLPKTSHCSRGHALTAGNYTMVWRVNVLKTKVTGYWYSRCHACNQLYNQQYWQRKRAKKATPEPEPVVVEEPVIEAAPRRPRGGHLPLQLGGYCTHGHLLVGDNVRWHTNKNGTVGLRCAVCNRIAVRNANFKKRMREQEAERERRAAIRATITGKL